MEINFLLFLFKFHINIIVFKDGKGIRKVVGQEYDQLPKFYYLRRKK